jgi:DNA-binding protein HU-beta
MGSRVAAKLGGSRAEGEAALNAVLEGVQAALAAGDRVVLTGFGSFEVRQVKARRVRPIRGGQAGTLITVPAHRRVGFTAGAELSKAAQG